MSYWEECITESFKDAGITATIEQAAIVADWVEGAHDNYSMACGFDAKSIDNEVKSIKKDINKLKESYERRLSGLREKFARKRNIDADRVGIN